MSKSVSQRRTWEALTLGSAGWRVPQGVEVEGRALTWTSDLRAAPRLAVAEPGVLDAFLKLRLVSETTLPEAVHRFAVRWGVLSYCNARSHERHPVVERFALLEPTPFVAPSRREEEPLEWWRALSERYAAILTVGTQLLGPSGRARAEDWWRAVPQWTGYWNGPAVPGTDPVQRPFSYPTLDAEGQRRAFAGYMSQALEREHVRPIVDIHDGQFIDGYAVGCLLGALTLSVLRAIQGGQVPCLFVLDTGEVCGEPVAARVDPPRCDQHRRVDRSRARRQAMTLDQREAERLRKATARARARGGV